MNVSDLDEGMAWLLNANDTQSSQAYSAARRLWALNRAYRHEVNIAKLEGGKRWFMATTEDTWTASAATYSLPTAMDQAEIVRIFDVTDVDPGVELVFSEHGYCGDISWKDRSTLQWGTNGPSSDRTLRYLYLPVAEALTGDSDIPALIPEAFHELLYVSAAIDLVEATEQRAASSWMSKQQDLRYAFWKSISKGRPHSDTPGVRRSDDFGGLSL